MPTRGVNSFLMVRRPQSVGELSTPQIMSVLLLELYDSIQ